MKEEIIKAMKVLGEVQLLYKKGIISACPLNNHVHIDGERMKIEEVPGALEETYNPWDRFFPWKYTKCYQGVEFMCLERKRKPDMYGRPKMIFKNAS